MRVMQRSWKGKRLRPKRDDRDIPAGFQPGIQGADPRHPMKDPIVLKEDGIKRIGQM